MKTAKLSNLKTFLSILSLSYLCTQASVVQSQPQIAQSPNFHAQLLPVGVFTFYEKALKKNVSYSREGNKIIGVVYDPSNPKAFTCFHGNIGSDGFVVSWWNNLQQIGQANKSYYERFYTVPEFTADNTNFRPGNENPKALTQCVTQMGSFSDTSKNGSQNLSSKIHLYSEVRSANQPSAYYFGFFKNGNVVIGLYYKRNSGIGYCLKGTLSDNVITQVTIVNFELELSGLKRTVQQGKPIDLNKLYKLDEPETGFDLRQKITDCYKEF